MKAGLANRRKRLPSQRANVSPEKARKILHDGSVRGHALTTPQRGMFGAIASRKREY